MKRKLTGAQKAQPKKSGRVEKAINFITKLYGIEQEAKGLSAVERQQLRQQKLKPILKNSMNGYLKPNIEYYLKSALVGCELCH
ncbi:IS66 family transposase [Photobacterium leiognathi]|uniref:IS66 family transposase n=1 Tax=Photobacterium leiognathi TaxID=553611 RepID=UPI0029818DA8|nr:transposase [Photobacterium leiognathi]